ncbi:MAG: FtsW/RodA/SpoVE family cell cycle protein [Lentisphaeria bacterium]
MIIVLVMALAAFGATMLYSTSYDTFGTGKLKLQLIWLVLGAVIAVLVRLVDHHWLTRYSPWILGAVSAALLYLAGAHLLSKVPGCAALAAHIPFTGGVKGAYRWLSFPGGVRLQPSEFVKLGLILFLASYFARGSRFMGEFWRGVLQPVLYAGGAMLLVLMGGSLSVTVITGGVVVVLFFVGGVRMRYVLPVFAALAAGFLAVKLVDNSTLEKIATTVHSPGIVERLSRLTSYRDPEAVQDGDGYQLWFSQLALGSGGWNGLGFTNSRMKKHYLPEAHTDFILSIVGEELGYVAVAGVIGAYLMLTLMVFWLAAQAADREGSLICAGVGASLGLHAFVNISVVSGFLPTTGVTAPFISYGGSSVLASAIGVGLLLSVARYSERCHLDQEAQAQEEAAAAPPLMRSLFN